MCGFVGAFEVDGHPGRFDEQLARIQHRGPDAIASWSDDLFSVSHCRLKIQDLSDEANQPLVSEDGRYVLSYNGEVYNAPELREQLQARGQQFQTRSDTEVVLYLLVHEGVRSLRKLNGCYAIAFYDLEAEEVVLARDPMGIKPLYYRKDQNGQVCFASEYKALKQEGDTWNSRALADFLQTGFSRGITLVSGLESVDPSYPVVLRKGREVAKKFDPTPANPKMKLLDCLRASVHDRLVSDVPLGAFLSGGIDSSAISALAIEKKQDLKTFSLGFKDKGVLDERDAAREMAEHIGSDHHELELSEDDLLHSLDAWIASLDLPFGDASALAVYHLSRFAREHVTVALSGDGADELFAGYNRHRAFQRAAKEKALWKVLSKNASVRRNLARAGQSRESKNGLRAYQLGRFLHLQCLPESERYGFLTRFVSPQRCAEVFAHEASPFESGVNSLRSFLTMDQRIVLREDMLVKVDRMSMAHGLEVRVPFLDPRVVNVASTLSDKELIWQGTGKWALREAVKNLLPLSILTRPKRGFEIPMQRWLSGPLSQEVDTYLNPERFSEAEGWIHSGLKEIRDEFKRRPTPELTHLVWNLWVLKRWESAN